MLAYQLTVNDFVKTCSGAFYIQIFLFDTTQLQKMAWKHSNHKKGTCILTPLAVKDKLIIYWQLYPKCEKNLILHIAHLVKACGHIN